MIDAHGISSDLSREAFTDALRRYVGHGKRWSVHALAEEAGLDARTVAAYRGGETAPSLANMLRLFAVLPPAFADEVLALSGLGGVKRLQGERADSLELNTNVTGLAAMIARHLSDDELDSILKGESPLRVWRKKRGLTLEALAGLTGFGKSMLSQVENGTKTGSVDLLRKCAAALAVDIDDLA